MARARSPLTFGAGLDRATGAGKRDPRSLYDGLNVVAREAGLELRAGLQGAGLPVLDWGTDILATFSVERTKDILQVVFDRETRGLRIYRVNPIDTPTRQLVGTWGTVHASALFPVITHAEAGGVVYFAHAEDTMAYRLATQRWTPGANDTDAGTLATAAADLDGSGSTGSIYFHGVAAWGVYIVGWGWGTETNSVTSDRPEIVRITKPDDPTVWPSENYFICGSRSSRVLCGAPIGGGFLVCTGHQRFTITGTDPETWGVALTDPSHGAVSPRAIAIVNGAAYTWAATGPRLTVDAAASSEDLSIPLDLGQAMPTHWPARGPAREMFSAWEPNQRVLLWVWPNLTAEELGVTFAYQCSLRQAGAPRYTAAKYLRRLASAGRLLTGKTLLPPTVSPGGEGNSTLVLSDQGWSEPNSGRTLRASYAYPNALGSETVEVWIRPAGGSWSLATTRAVTTGTMTSDLTGKESLTSYDVAIRLRSFLGEYGAGFIGPDPDSWSDTYPTEWKQTLVSGASTPTLSVPTYQRTSNVQVVFNFDVTGADARCPVYLEQNTGSGWSEVTNATRTGGSLSITLAVTPLIGGTPSYRARHRRGADVGTYSGTVSRFVGILDVAPALLKAFDISEPGPNVRAVELYTRLPASRVLQIECTDTAQQWIETQRIGTLGRGYQFTTSLVGGGVVNYRLRVGAVAFGVYDWGPWSAPASIICNPSGSTPPLSIVNDTNFYLYPGSDPHAAAGTFDASDLLYRPWAYEDGVSWEGKFYRLPLYAGTYRYAILSIHPAGEFSLTLADAPAGSAGAAVDDAVGNPDSPTVPLLGAKAMLFFADPGLLRRGPVAVVK